MGPVGAPRKGDVTHRQNVSNAQSGTPSQESIRRWVLTFMGD